METVRDGLVVSAQDDDGMRTALCDRGGELVLTEHTPTARTVTPVARDGVPELLAARFGLDGFALGAEGRVVLAAG